MGEAMKNWQLSDGDPGRVNPRAKVRAKRKPTWADFVGWGVAYPTGSFVALRKREDAEIRMEIRPTEGQRLVQVVARLREVTP